MHQNRFQVPRTLVFVAFAVAGTAAACGESKSDGKGGPNAAGAANGGASGWTYLPPGSEVAGTPSKSGNGAGGSSGGSAGSAGSAGQTQAGTGGTAQQPVPFGCDGQVPSQAIITSFDNFTQDRWVSPGTLNGGVYVYPDPLKPQAGDFLRFSDPVKTYTGMGVWFAGCINASKFKGVRFAMSGTVGIANSVMFYAITQSNRDIAPDLGVGACAPADPEQPWLSCSPNGVRLPVTADSKTVSVLWSDLKGGMPNATTDGSDVIALQWSFDWQAGSNYNATLTVDDLVFLTDDDSGTGGAGGAGAGGEPGTDPGTLPGSAGVGGAE